MPQSVETTFMEIAIDLTQRALPRENLSMYMYSCHGKDCICLQRWNDRLQT